MRLLALSAAVFGVACGDPAGTPPDAPPDLVCAMDEMACDDTCVATMTDEDNCGTCGNECRSTEACITGSCMPAKIHCQRVREEDPDAPDGTYVNPSNNDAFYCDFTNDVTIDNFAIAPYNKTVPDYTLLTGDALAADATLQKAFIGLFNAGGGLRGLETFNPTNCCINVAMETALLFGDMAMTPLNEGVASCDVIGANRVYTFELSGSPTDEIVQPPLPEDYFTTHPISQGDKCSEGEQPNPGFFYKKHAGLL